MAAKKSVASRYDDNHMSAMRPLVSCSPFWITRLADFQLSAVQKIGGRSLRKNLTFIKAIERRKFQIENLFVHGRNITFRPHRTLQQ
jgi:hypothetical protein